MSRISSRAARVGKIKSDDVTYHIIPTENGAWRVKRSGAERADSVHETKDQAVGRARHLAKEQAPGQVIIHKKDGSIQKESTYGKDRAV
jgi:hypothetical protein